MIVDLVKCTTFRAFYSFKVCDYGDFCMIGNGEKTTCSFCIKEAINGNSGRMRGLKTKPRYAIVEECYQ